MRSKLKHMLTAHQGVFIATPEYTASVTPLLKNAIDWIVARARARRASYAAFKDRVFASGSASARADGGLHALLALRQILELGCGALVLPEQINVGRADDAFDDMDNLKDEDLTTDLEGNGPKAYRLGERHAESCGVNDRNARLRRATA